MEDINLEENKDWDGKSEDGLPPIGSICETTIMSREEGALNKWHESKILGYYCEIAWIKCIGNGELYYYYHKNEFRKVDRRDDKEKFVDDFVEQTRLTEEMANHMYSQGFRKLNERL